MMKRFIISCIVFMQAHSIEAQVTQSNNSFEKGIETCNVVWDSPSQNSFGSMPTGNGDIGINLWVEEGGDLLFYLSKTDAWSENGRLLKLGKLRLSLSPNPFKKNAPFTQELILEEGVIRIEAGEKEEQVRINVWVDANHPVVELDVTSKVKVDAYVEFEPWRTAQRVMDNKAEMHSAYGLSRVVVEQDTIFPQRDKSVVWAHRNERSIWKDNLTLQGLEAYAENDRDPLLHRTFGGLLCSDQLQITSSKRLETSEEVKKFSLSVFALTAQTETLKAWKEEIEQLADDVTAKSRRKRASAHKDWWKSFWERSYLFVDTPISDEKERSSLVQVNQNYNLQRYMNACSGRGNSPIKFNGSIFTVDTKSRNDRYAGFDADYRQWGGPYWWQNTRLPYWAMLESGDFELMRPLFRMYAEALDIRKFATKTYYQHDGAFFPETMHHWGTFADANYGVDRTNLSLGMTQNTFIRYYWQGGLELSLMMLDYFQFTGDKELMEQSMLPVITEVITFFDQHWSRGGDGKILFDPAMALETYRKAVNPLVEIVGIHKICTELLRLPPSLLNDAQRKQYERLITELPAIPMREKDGEQLLAPAQSYSEKQNVENPELYAIFPYLKYTVGKENLELAIRTFTKRDVKENRGWQQHSIKAAYLGLAEEAATLMAQNFNSSTSLYRFPTMWGPNYDWVPDQCHGNVAMTALQRMLLQYEGEKIFLFPAWKRSWDVDFKLYAPQNTVIKGSLRNGEITKLKVTPKAREKDVINMLNIAEKQDREL